MKFVPRSVGGKVLILLGDERLFEEELKKRYRDNYGDVDGSLFSKELRLLHASRFVSKDDVGKFCCTGGIGFLALHE